MSKYFKKADLILLIVILALSVLGFILLRHPADENARLEISIEGKVRETHSLSHDQIYEVKSDYGYNIIQVKDGQVSVTDADCAGGDCVNFAPISKEGEVILCLPHKLSVRIIGGEEALDAVSY